MGRQSSKIHFILGLLACCSVIPSIRGQHSSCPASWATGFDWVGVCEGDLLRGGAVMAGHALMIGDVYVARSIEGEPGKLSMKDGRVHGIYTHSQGFNSCAELLVLDAGFTHQWFSYRKGDLLPEGIVFAGETTSDGKVYVGRNKYSGMYGNMAGKVNVDGDKLHNLWTHGTALPWLFGEILVVKRPEVHPNCDIPPNGYEWARVCRGEMLRGGVVMAGYTSTDFHTYVGRSIKGEPGKINLDNGTMYSFWSHQLGQDTCAESLVVHAGWTQEWVPYRKGDPIPDGVVFAGETSSDGKMYVGRHLHSKVYGGSSCGKINVDNGRLHNLWVHGYTFSWGEGEILVVKRQVATR